MTFEEVGIILRTEREKRGLALDEVAAYLKINARILRALEEGNADALPHTVYVRGFLRSYGTYLGLNSEELQAAMESLTDEEVDMPPISVYANPEVHKSGGSGKMLLGLAILLCLGGGGLFWLNRDADLFSDLQKARLSTAQPAPPAQPAPSEGNKAENVATAATVSADKDSAADKADKSQKGNKPEKNLVPPVAVPPVSGTAGTARTGAQAPVTQIPAAQIPVPQAPPAPQTPAPQTPSQSPVATAPVTPAAAPAATRAAQPSSVSAPVSVPHKVIITALAECWIHSTADDTDTRQFSLRKGDTFALTFADKLVLKLGNAGGVRIRYNGADMDAPGRDGQVRILTFPPAPQ